MDNQIDGIVLDVLLRKHKRIRSSLGISVPIPGDTEEVVEAIFEGLLLREGSGGGTQDLLPGFEEYLRPKKEDLFGRWDNITDREKRSRTVFSQQTVRVDEVDRELEAVRSAVGSGVDVAVFAKESLKAHGAAISENGNVKIDLSEIPRAAREAIGATDGTDRIAARFELPVGEGEVYLSRTHPLIEGLASHVMDAALDPLGEGIARRSGVTVTSRVARRTTLLLVRYRYHILTRRGTRRGRLRKAREGKVIAGRQADYGFRYSESRDGYVVHEPEMATVRRILEMLGVEGASVWGVKSALDASKVPPPRGVVWQRTFIRDCVFDDVYKPHTFEEVSDLVPPQVAAGLDPERLYGVWWYNRRDVQRKRVLEEGAEGERRYVTRTRYADKPREEWIAVPVPDAGVPREVVDRAREALRSNEKYSSAGRRLWELSGGILRCVECGRASWR